MLEKTNTTYFLLTLSTLAVIYFAYSLQTLLSPLLMFLLILFLVYPLRENVYANRLLWVTAILFIVWFASTLSGLLSPFIIGFVLAYLFEPLMAALCRWKIPRSLAALLITLFGVGGLAVTIILIAPEVSNQLAALFSVVQMLPEKLQEIGEQLPQLEILTWLNIDIFEVQKKLIELLTARVSDIGTLTANIATTIAKSIPKLISLITNIILIPFLSFYFLNDYEAIQKTVNKLLPGTHAPIIKKYMELASGIFRQYLRGYLIIMAIEMILYTLSFTLIGINYPLLLGIISGLMLFIPYIGIAIAITLTTLVTLLGDNIGHHLLLAGITFASVQSFENFFLIPKIVGSKVKLNPIMLFLSIFLFGYFFGFIGIVIAIPVSAFLVAIFSEKFLSQSETSDSKSDAGSGKELKDPSEKENPS